MGALWALVVNVATFINHLNLVCSVALETSMLISGFALLFFVVLTAQE